MGFFSSIGSFVSGAVSAVRSAVSTTFNAAKEIVGKTIGWMAEKAEGFVDGVKNVWNTVRPYVSDIRAALKAAAATVPIPWVSAALLGLEKGLGALTAFENSPIAKKIDAAIKWSINLAKRWQDKSRNHETEEENLSESELEEARRHQENMRFAEREIMSDEERHQMELASAINDYEIAKADLNLALSKDPENFEHYLRLRATQKLIAMTDKKFRSAKTVDDLSADDLFLVRIASDLVKANPELSTIAATRLDRVLFEKYGQKLTPFVFEELIASWAARAKELGVDWDKKNRQLSKDLVCMKGLRLAKEIQDSLSVEDSNILAELEVSTQKDKLELDDILNRQLDIERYAGAAEGFLQLLEKSEDEIESEGRTYLIEDGAEVGRLLIACAESNRDFNSLNQGEKSLIIDYSNIFKKESKTRMAKVLEVSV